MAEHRRQWRDYETEAGNRPVKKFLRDVKAKNPDDAAAILVAIQEVADEGLGAARHLDGDIHEVRVDGEDAIYRVLFAPQGRFKHIFLSLDGFKKKTQKTPPQKIALAKKRLRDWEKRGREKTTKAASDRKRTKKSEGKGKSSTRRRKREKR